MSYTILRTNGSLLTTIPDGFLNTTSTPLSLPGRNYASYGQIVDTNFVRALENFANSTPPANAMKGQLWYNTTANVLYICPIDGETNANNWYPVLTPQNISNLVVDNLTANSNVASNNASITNDLSANKISTNYLTVNVSANINGANLIGTTIANSITTTNITTGSNVTSGTLTGNWSLNGALSSNGNVSASGVKTDNYYYANGNPVSFDGTYSNSNVAAYLPIYVGNVGEAGNSTIFNGRTLSAGSNLTTGNIIGNWILSTGSKITGLSDIDGANITGTVANATNAANANIANTVRNNAQPNITSVGTLTSLAVSGNVSFTGQVSNLGPVGNVRILGGSPGQVLSTNGSGGLSWVSSTAADTAITVTANAQPNITSTGTLTSLAVSGSATISGNISSGNTSTGSLSATGNVNLTGANVTLGSTSTVRITGGSPGFVLTTDGSGGLSWTSAGSATTAQTVTNNAQPNITSVGTLSGLSVTGTTVSGNVFANSGTVGASLLSGTLTTSSQPNITGVGTLSGLAVSGNANFTGPVVNLGTVGNLRISGGSAGQVLLSTGAGGVTWGGANISADTAITVTGNAQPNITSLGTLSSLDVTGNVSVSGRFIGSGAGLTNVPAAAIVGTVPSAASAVTAGTVTSPSQSNITSLGTLTGLTVSGSAAFTGPTVNLGAVGNIRIAGGTSGQVLLSTGAGGVTWGAAGGGTSDTAITVTGNAQPNITSVGTLTSLSTSGNITAAGIFIGNGFGLTNLQGSSVSGTVASATSASSATTAGTVTTAAQPNITSVGTLTALTVSGNITSSSGRFIGNGSGLTNIVAANIVGTVANASYATSAGSATTATSAGSATTATSAGFATSAGSATTAGTVTNPNQSNITSVGTLSSLSVSGSVTAGSLSATNINATSGLTRAGQPVLTLADFTNGSGWTRLPNGLILQYGTATASPNATTTIPYPTSFISFSVAVVSGGEGGFDAQDNNPYVTSTTTTNFSMRNARDASCTVWWIAIGY